MFSHRIAARRILGVLLLAVALGLAACAPGPLGVQRDLDATSTAVVQDASHTPPSIPVTGWIQITDAAGRDVTLGRVPQRIVVVGRASHMVLHALHLFPQGRDRLVGLDKKNMTSLEFLQLVDPGFAGRTIMEGTPGVEQIAALQPDLVLMKSPAAQDLTAGLATLGIPVVYLGLETPALFEKDIANLGAVLGAPERAREIADFYRARLDMVAQALLDLPEAERSRVLLCQYSSKGGEAAVSVPAETWMQTILVEKAGGVPVWLENAEPTSGWKTINLEQVVLWDPDQIVIVAYGADPQEIIAKLEADPVWGALQAVQQDHLHVFPADYFGWDMADPRWILGLEWLAARLYPDHLPGLDMADEVRQFYGRLYGVAPSAVDAQIMPKLELD